MPIQMVHENFHIYLTNDMDPYKNWGTPYFWLKITKTECAMIVSGLDNIVVPSLIV